ncbi:MAG: transcriptional repressor LexA [Lactobacillus sp.]|jgi:repressor LexA|nr:transcriptional repressor LexA [Lactobacillus sp.]
MLTPKQYKLLMFIKKTLQEKGVSPSFDEMKEAVGLKSKSGIHALIEALNERGFIRKLPHKARALEVIKSPKLKPSAIVAEEKLKEENLKKQLLAANSVEVPLYGKIAAGTPIEAIANEVETVSVPSNLLPRGNCYALSVEGDSMMDAGILDGDTVIIKKVETANNGDVVVALIDNSIATLKVFKREAGKIHLIPKNSEYETRVLEANRVQIQGVLSGLMRAY